MVRFFAVYQAKCSVLVVVVRNSTTAVLTLNCYNVRPGMFRGTFQQYHDTESWYGIQYLTLTMVGRNEI